MTPSFSLRQRLRYRFDNALSRGIWAVLAWLGVVAVGFVLLIAVLITLTGIGPADESTSFGEGLWLAMTRALDSGTFTGDEGAKFRLIMLAVTIAGIFLAATIISELVEANLSERGLAIVVMTASDTVEVTEDIRGQVTDLKTSRLVVRSGTPTRISDLAQGNPQSAKSVIVLKGDGESDAHVVKIVLALQRLVPGLEGITVVAEMDDPETAAALRAAVGDSLLTVIPTDVIARISAQVSRAAGLGAIYQELLDFDGDEMYTTPITPSLVGRNFGELTLASSGGTIIGLRHADGQVELSPAGGTVLRADDFAIGIAQDDSTFHLDLTPESWSLPDERHWTELSRHRERTLIVGWSDLTPLIAREIEAHVADGSELHLMVNPAIQTISLTTGAMKLSRQSLTIHEGNPINRSDIDRVIDMGPFDHVMLLAERGHYPADEADARTLLTLMHVRAATAHGDGNENITAELIDPNDVELGGVDSRNDFIVSQKLISLLMTQLSESPHLADVLADLFDAEGAVVSLHPASRYLPAGETSFADVIRACRDFSVTAIGYRSAAALDDPLAIGPGIRVNPASISVLSASKCPAILAPPPAKLNRVGASAQPSSLRVTMAGDNNCKGRPSSVPCAAIDSRSGVTWVTVWIE